MPLYEFSCPKCKDVHGDPKRIEVYRPMSSSGAVEVCPDCKSKTERIYSFNREKEFFSYEDEQYQCSISSRRKEKELMKKHGHVDFRETAAYGRDRWKEARSIARRKPTYFIPGVAQVHRGRD